MSETPTVFVGAPAGERLPGIYLREYPITEGRKVGWLLIDEAGQVDISGEISMRNRVGPYHHERTYHSGVKGDQSSSPDEHETLEGAILKTIKRINGRVK